MSRIARWTRWIIPTLAALLLIMGTVGTTTATERGPTTTPTPAYPALEQQYRLQQQQLRSLGEMLTREERRSAEIIKMIAYAKAAGKNTTALEQALATYRSALSNARADWQTAATTLNTHAGFSATGKVAAPDTARATLKTTGSALERSYLTARGAENALNQALATFRNQK